MNLFVFKRYASQRYARKHEIWKLYIDRLYRTKLLLAKLIYRLALAKVIRVLNINLLFTSCYIDVASFPRFSLCTAFFTPSPYNFYWKMSNLKIGAQWLCVTETWSLRLSFKIWTKAKEISRTLLCSSRRLIFTRLMFLAKVTFFRSIRFDIIRRKLFR